MTRDSYRAIRCCELADRNFVRLIYTDEAGTSANEPVCVVAAVVVHADDQWRILESEIQRIVKEKVPAQIQENFHIHATDIYSGGKIIKRDEWSWDDRLDFLKEIVCLPLVHDVPIAVGIEFKDARLEKYIVDSDPRNQGPILRKKVNALAHLLAFNTAMEKSDSFLRKYLDGKEIGSVVAEDVDRMKQLLTDHGLMFRGQSIEIPSEAQKPDAFHLAAGMVPKPYEYRIDHIVDVPHFVKKGKAPILQLADVCAFSFRHCLSRKPHGDDLVRAMLGPIAGDAFVNDEIWYSGCHSGLFNTQSYWKEEHVREAQAAHLTLALRNLLSEDR